MENGEAIKKDSYSSVHIEQISRNRYLKLIHIDAIKCKTYLIFLFQGVKFESGLHKLGNDNSMKSIIKNRWLWPGLEPGVPRPERRVLA